MLEARSALVSVASALAGGEALSLHVLLDAAAHGELLRAGAQSALAARISAGIVRAGAAAIATPRNDR